MKTKDIFFYLIGALFVIGFFISLVAVIWKPLPGENTTTISIMFGCLIAGVSTVLNFFYGSSKGSQDKTDLLSKKDTPQIPQIPQLPQEPQEPAT